METSNLLCESFMEIFGTQGFWGPAYKVIFAQVIEDSQVIEDMRTLQFLGKKKKLSNRGGEIALWLSN